MPGSRDQISLNFNAFRRKAGDWVKRAFDVFASLTLLAVLWPVFLLVARAIRRDSPGPVFYRGPRIGMGGKPFYILKFRTMWETPHSYQGPRVTAQDDERVTPLGRWLRNSKLNELPQLINVLKGEMSMVGPRPEDPELAKTWPSGARREILSVRPGITSPASVQYHDEERLLAKGDLLQKYLQELGPDKQRLDRLYVRYRSFWLDLDTLLWTALVLLPRLRAHPPPEPLLFVGPITRLARRYLRWFTIDLGVALLAMAIAGGTWRLFGPLNVGLPLAALLAGVFAGLYSGVGALLGVNRIAWSKADAREAYSLLPGWGLATVLALLANAWANLLPPDLILAAAGLALGGFLFTRYRSRLVTGLLSRALGYHGRARAARERALVIGSGASAQLAAWLLDHPSNAGRFWVVGFVDNDLFRQGMRIYGAQVLGRCQDLPRLVKQYDAGLVILADDSLPAETCRQALEACQQAHARLVVIPDFLATLQELLESAPPQFWPADWPESLPTFQTNPGTARLRCQHCLARCTLARLHARPEAQPPARDRPLTREPLAAD